MILSIDEPGPKKTLRADRPPTEGFVTIVDGHFPPGCHRSRCLKRSNRSVRCARRMSAFRRGVILMGAGHHAPIRAITLIQQVCFSYLSPRARALHVALMLTS
jgi:hypothetical protein